MKYFKILTPQELRNFSKKESIIYFLLYTFAPFIPVLLIVREHIFDQSFILTIIPFLLIFMGNASLVFIYKYSQESEVLSKIHPGCTYQLSVLLLTVYFPGLSLFFVVFNYFLDNLILGIILGCSFIIPFLTIFRRNIFNDSSAILDEEIVFGYNPRFYMIISVCLGLIGYYISFRESSIVAMAMIILIQLILLFPDLMNKIIPVDIRLKEYFLLFISIIIIIFLIIILILNNNLALNFNLYSILKWVFIGILSIIFYKWYINKIK